MGKLCNPTIDDVIRELRSIKKVHGNIKVTCTGTLLPDGHGKLSICDKFGDVFETTVGTLIVNENHPVYGKAVRIWL